MNKKVLILDFGSQVTQLIARRVREIGVYSEVWPYNADIKKIESYNPAAIILSGGPASTTVAVSPRCDAAVFKLGVPILGICYGEQLICASLGGKVEAGLEREFGKTNLNIKKDSPLFAGFWQSGDIQKVWMSHGDRVINIPEGFEVIATSEGAPFAAIADESRKIYGVQFHPEVTHTPDGAKLLDNFVTKIAAIDPDWSMASFKDEAINSVRLKVGDKRVLCAVSGGVDSSVVANLLHEAIGDQLQCIFVDTGLLRQDEGRKVAEMFRRNYHINLLHIDASDKFLGQLEGVNDPETKRKIIGGMFIEIFEEEAKKLGQFEFLAQGTLYPDVIESVSFTGVETSTIKSHHNVGGLPERMNMKLIEPVRELFKDEVRALGRELGMSDELLKRHPFPGPGLAIRIPGEITREKVEILQKADEIYINAIRDAGLYDEIWQAFAVLLPVKTVGVMGDARTYEYVCALRAVTSQDGMTADFYHFDYDFIGRVSNKIVNEVKGINRIVYDITSKPPGTIEWE